MDSKTKIRLFSALEVIVWLLVIVMVVGFIRYKHEKRIGEYRTYRIFMQDVDGLIEGSSVRMMGVPIGYIKTINIVQDEVYVKFVVTEENVELPSGVIATVEFIQKDMHQAVRYPEVIDGKKLSGQHFNVDINQNIQYRYPDARILIADDLEVNILIFE